MDWKTLLLETVQHFALILTNDGQVEQCNELAPETLNVQTTQHIGQWFPSLSEDHFARITREVLSVGVWNRTVNHDDGQWVLHLRHLPDESGWFLWVEDLRPQSQTYDQIKRLQDALTVAEEKLNEARQTQGAFLASMSHELRTPLNAIIGYTELIIEDAEELELDYPTDDLQHILESAQHLLHLINNILELSLIESKRSRVQWEQVQLDEIFDELVTMGAHMAEQNHNTFEVNVEEALGECWLDRSRLHQIIYNLLSNASKFTTEGTIKLDVHIEPEFDTSWLVCRVQDTGVGIPQDKLEQVFDAFHQADSSTTRTFGGAGLGLALARHFCVMLGGSLDVHSVIGHGSTFTVKVPYHGHVAKSLEELSELVHIKKPGEDATTMLIIDDDPKVHMTVKNLLEGENMVFFSAFNGLDGLSMARQLKPNMITLDVLMPGLNGWSVLSKLKSDKELAHIPVIVLSLLNDKNMGYALGATDFLTKPLDRQKLLKVLTRYQKEDGEGHMLLIDDEPNLRDILRRRIEDEGWRVTEAPDGQSALDAVARDVPDVVILDLMMPNMDGFEFLDQLRRQAHGKHIPVIVLTAMTLDQTAINRLQGQVEQIIEKGLDTGNSLIEAIKHHMDHKA